MNNFCDDKCCSYLISQYIPKKRYEEKKKFDKIDRKEKPKKAGIFITNNDMSKILLVQSKGQLWGPPKGTIETDETISQGAIREVKEETGLIFNEEFIGNIQLIKGRAFYYHVKINECKLQIQDHIQHNDANGIGWFSVKCLDNMIKKGEIMLNQHCRCLIRKFFNIMIPQNCKKRLLKPTTLIKL